MQESLIGITRSGSEWEAWVAQTTRSLREKEMEYDLERGPSTNLSKMAGSIGKKKGERPPNVLYRVFSKKGGGRR